MIGGFQGSHRRAHNLLHLFILHIVNIFHVEDETLFLREGENRFLQFELDRIAIEVAIALQAFQQEQVGIIHRDLIETPLAIQKRNAFVDGNLVKPGRKFGLTAKIVDVAPGLQECILQQIVRIVVTQYHFSDLPVELLAVSGYNPSEGVALLRRIVPTFDYSFL